MLGVYFVLVLLNVILQSIAYHLSGVLDGAE